MAYRPFNIAIPEVETDQVLGATMLNSYGRMAGALLAEAQSEYSLAKCKNSHTSTSTSYATKETRWIVHSKNTLFYAIALRSDVNSICYLRVWDQTRGVQLAELQHQGNTWQFYTGTVANAFSAYANGDIIELQLQLRTAVSGLSANAWIFAVGQQGVINTWPGVPAFADGTTSTAQDLNDVRDCLLRLENSKVPATATLLASEPMNEDVGDDVAHTIQNAVYRYRGNRLVVFVEGFAVNGWKLWVDIYRCSAPSTKVGSVQGSWADAAWKWHGLDIDMAALGFTLGEWVRIRIYYQRLTGPNGGWRRVAAYRSGAPTPTWSTPRLWAEGDTAVGNAELSKLASNVAQLYTGGALELWGQNIATLAAPDTVEGDGPDRACTGMHRKRWLLVKQHKSEPVTLTYGPSFSLSETLPTVREDRWNVFDMDEYELPYGGLYILTGIDVALESDLAPVTD